VEGVGRELVVYRERFFIDGWAEDAGGLADVSLSGESLLGEDTGVRRFYFSRLVNLAEGPNEYVLRVTDANGNVTEKIFEVTYKVPVQLTTRYRLTMGVPPVISPRDIRMGAKARAAIKASIAHDRPRFKLLARDEGLEDLLLEQELSLSDLAEERGRITIRFKAAELLLMTQFIYEPGGITFFGSAVDTEQGEILCYEDVYTEAPEDYRELKRKALGLVLQIEQKFPLVEGRVTGVRGSRATLNIGTRHGIRSGTRFVAARAGGADADRGDVLVHEAGWVELRATDPEYEVCQALVLPGGAARLLREGDEVFAR
jgi:hypothetical protein